MKVKGPSACSICGTTPAVWQVRGLGFCMKHKEEAYEAGRKTRRWSAALVSLLLVAACFGAQKQEQEMVTIPSATVLLTKPAETLHGKVVNLDRKHNNLEVVLTVEPKETRFTFSGIPEGLSAGDWVHFNIAHNDAKFKGKPGNFQISRILWTTED